MPYSLILYFQMLFNVKFASHLVRTRTTMKISSTPIAFCIILDIVIMCKHHYHCITCTYIAE